MTFLIIRKLVILFDWRKAETGCFSGFPHVSGAEDLISDKPLKSGTSYLLQKTKQNKAVKQKFRWKIDFWYVNAVSIATSMTCLLGGMGGDCK